MGSSILLSSIKSILSIISSAQSSPLSSYSTILLNSVPSFSLFILLLAIFITFFAHSISSRLLTIAEIIDGYSLALLTFVSEIFISFCASPILLENSSSHNLVAQ